MFITLLAFKEVVISIAYILAVGALFSLSLTILDRSETDLVLWPEIIMATRSGIPVLTMFLTAVRRKS